jgi:hypothetical protein
VTVFHYSLLIGFGNSLAIKKWQIEKHGYGNVRWIDGSYVKMSLKKFIKITKINFNCKNILQEFTFIFSSFFSFPPPAQYNKFTNNKFTDNKSTIISLQYNKLTHKKVYNKLTGNKFTFFV